MFEDVLRERFGYQEGADGEAFTPVQRALLDLPFRGYVTTNYDPGLIAARSAARPGVRESGYATWKDRDLLHRWRTGAVFGERACPILHLHGHFEKPDSIVLADPDYSEAYRSAFVRELLANLWVEECLVFVGFGFSDVWFRMVATQVLGKTVHRVSGQPRHVALIGLPADQPFAEQMRADFRYRYDAEVLVYPVDADGHGHEDHRHCWACSTSCGRRCQCHPELSGPGPLFPPRRGRSWSGGCMTRPRMLCMSSRPTYSGVWTAGPMIQACGSWG